MGTLSGHLLPGAFFMVFSIWWSMITAIRFVKSKYSSSSPSSSYKTARSNQEGYRSSVTMPCICLPSRKLRKAPVESYVKIVLAFVGILGELVTGIKFNYVPTMNKDNALLFGCGEMDAHEHHHDHHESAQPVPVFFEHVNAHHITMYLAFMLASVVEVMLHYRVDLPNRLDYVCNIFAFGVEAFLFKFHLHSRAPLDIHLHTLLVLSIYGCIIFSILEMVHPSEVLFTYGRILFTCLQGTWFWQVGFILYPPVQAPFLLWDRCDHEQIMTITMTYCWHVMLIILALIVQLGVIKRMVTCTAGSSLILSATNFTTSWNDNESCNSYEKCRLDENDILVEYAEDNCLLDKQQNDQNV